MVALAVTLAASLVCQAMALFAAAPRRDAGDGETYIVPAENLAAGRGFVAPDQISFHYSDPRFSAPRPVVADTLRTPGYPLLLAAFLRAGWLEGVIVLQHLLCVALTAAVFLFTERVVGRLLPAFLAAMLFGLFPPLASSAHQYMTEILTALLVLVTIVVFWKAVRGKSHWWAAGAGLLTGCTTLVRPIAVYWFVPLAIVLFFGARRVVLTFLLASMALPGGWKLRNYRTTGEPVISSIEGENMLYCRAAGALVVHDAPAGFGWFAMQHQTGLYANTTHLRPLLTTRAFDAMRRDGIGPERVPHAVRDRYYERVGVGIVLRHIPETIQLGVSGVVEMFVGAYMGATHNAYEPDLPVILIVVLAVLVLAGACYGTVIVTRADRLLGWTMGITMVYFTALAAGLGAEPRFVVPFAPLYALAAGTGIGQFVTNRARARAAKAAAALRR